MAVTAATEPVEEGPEKANMRLRRTISWSVSEGVEEGARATEPVKEGPEEANMRLRHSISWSVSEGVEEGARVPLEGERCRSFRFL